ncbi:zinc finger protein DPF3-like isoform X1 [Hippocampus zosterae]|uniref:zinc finger protein DPF3-like isoform X1 n=1 Tax=Hippocampus zosterae TaxID=109293 RepID=UPI00223E32AC|nr:zinc finger protein DPF3-like isoform X1 [Hippocampus zosterae]
MATVIQNPLKALGDQFYKDAIEQCRSYNARLCAERSVRLPFLDSQTRVAQNNCYIWMERHQRSPAGVAAGQMYTYPARCWRKKRRLHTATDPSLGIFGLKLDNGLMSKDTLPTQSTTLEALLRGEGLDKRNSRNDEESLLEIQRVLEADAAEDAFNDDDDYEVDTPKRRHRGKGRGRGSGRRKAEMDDDKPYVCDNRYKQRNNSKSSTSVYAKRYRSRTGLSYHYTNSHLTEEDRAEERSAVSSRSPYVQPTDRHKRPKAPSGARIPNRYCEKCQNANKKLMKSGSPCTTCQCTPDGGEEKEDGGGGNAGGAEELFATTSESDASTFHGFEDDDLEEPAANSNGLSSRHR